MFDDVGLAHLLDLRGLVTTLLLCELVHLMRWKVHRIEFSYLDDKWLNLMTVQM